MLVTIVFNKMEHQMYYLITGNVECINDLPSEEFELTANLLGPCIETHGKLILRTLSYLRMTHTVNLV